MNLNYLKPDFDKTNDIEPSLWFPSPIKFENEVVIDKNFIVICFEQFSCMDEATKMHDYLKITNGTRIHFTNRFCFCRLITPFCGGIFMLL